MATNTIKTRIQHKNGSASDWSQATNFVPLKGELIIYNDATTPKIKIGDGTTLVENLPFVGASITMNGAIASSPSFYAPTSAGTAEQVLKSNGSGVPPSWITLGSNAYTSTAYLPLAGGTLTGSLSVIGSVQAGSIWSNQTSAEAAVGVWNGALNSKLYLYANSSACGIYFSNSANGSNGNVIKVTTDGAKTFYGDITGNAASVAWSGVTGKPSYYDAKAIKSITRSGTTFTYTCLDGSTGTFTQQDNNTTYSAGTGLSLSGTTLNIDESILTYNRYDQYATTGGYNLCYGTKKCEGWSYSLATTTATSQEEEYEGVKYIRFTRDSVEETSWKYCSNSKLDITKLKSGTYYTVSFDVCSSVSGYVSLVGIMTGSAQYNLAQETKQIDTQVQAGVWKRVKMRFKTVNSISDIGLHNQVVYLSIPATAPNSQIVLGRICVQEGATPGEYTDYESYYDNITSNNYTSYCAKASHTHSYLPLSGGTLTAGVYGTSFWANQSSGENQVGVAYAGGSLYFWGNNTSGTAGIWDTNLATWVISRNVSTGGYQIKGESVYGAVWNDYAEFRSQNEELKPGYITYCDDDGKLKLTTERLQKFEGVVSDTFGFAIGETDNCKTPLAVSGRALVYCDPEEEHFHSGDCVCAGPDGLAYRMIREEIIEFPDRIVGVVSEIPTYETWGTGNVKVNGRIWIKIK